MKLKHAITLSFLLHLVLMLGLKVAYYEGQEKEPPEKSWLELQDEERRPLMSDKTRRVKKETRIKETSPDTLGTINKPESAGSRAQQTQQRSRSQNAGQNQNRNNGQTLGEALRAKTSDSGDVFMNPNQGGGGPPPMPSQYQERLRSFLPPELAVGDVQNLNTDYNVYFTFYQRMADKIYWPWAQNVVSAFERMRSQNQIGPGSRAWITVVEVLLDEKGSLVSVQPLQLSGLYEIDNAPAKAFKQAKNFPNPPSEMVEEDGYIHIRYKFIVYYNPKANF